MAPCWWAGSPGSGTGPVVANSPWCCPGGPPCWSPAAPGWTSCPGWPARCAARPRARPSGSVPATPSVPCLPPGRSAVPGSFRGAGSVFGARGVPFGPVLQRGVQLGTGAVQPSLADRGQLLAAFPQPERLLQGEPARLEPPYHVGQLVTCPLVRQGVLPPPPPPPLAPPPLSSPRLSSPRPSATRRRPVGSPSAWSLADRSSRRLAVPGCPLLVHRVLPCSVADLRGQRARGEADPNQVTG